MIEFVLEFENSEGKFPSEKIKYNSLNVPSHVWQQTNMHWMKDIPAVEELMGEFNTYVYVSNPTGALKNLITHNKKPGMVVAEIGTWQGESTKTYIDTIRNCNGHLYAVDWFKGSENAGPGSHGYSKNVDKKNKVLENFHKNLNGYQDIITVLEGKSHDMIKQIPDNSLDICFIDCDHRYDAVYKDIELCIPKMKEGGILCGHDCETTSIADMFTPEELQSEFMTVNSITDPRWKDKCDIKSADLGIHPGVIQAVKDHFGEDGVTTLPELIWVRKNKDWWE